MIQARVRPRDQVAALVDVEIAVTPVSDVIKIARLLNAPEIGWVGHGAPLSESRGDSARAIALKSAPSSTPQSHTNAARQRLVHRRMGRPGRRHLAQDQEEAARRT